MIKKHEVHVDNVATEQQPWVAVLAFTAWLTCRETAVTFGARHDAAGPAALVAEFCTSQGYEQPREGWDNTLKPYPAA